MPHTSGRRRCAAVPHNVDRYTEPHYLLGGDTVAAAHLQCLRGPSMIKCALGSMRLGTTPTVDPPALLKFAAGA
jgi:hypothetical protein